MEFQKRRRELVLALVAVLIIFSLKAKCCIAALVVKSNTAYECKGHRRLDECRIADDLELELDNLDFLLNPKVIRILQQAGNSTVTGDTNNPNQSSQSRCPPGEQYSACIANGGQPANCRGQFDRGCGQSNP